MFERWLVGEADVARIGYRSGCPCRPSLGLRSFVGNDLRFLPSCADMKGDTMVALDFVPGLPARGRPVGVCSMGRPAAKKSVATWQKGGLRQARFLEGTGVAGCPARKVKERRALMEGETSAALAKCPRAVGHDEAVTIAVPEVRLRHHPAASTRRTRLPR